MKAAFVAVALIVACSIAHAEEDDEPSAVAVADAHDMTPADRDLAEAEKMSVVGPLSEALRREEQGLKDATKARDRDRIASAKLKVSAAKKQLNERKQLTLPEWLRIARERLAFEKQEREAVEKQRQESAASRAEAAKTRPLAIVGTKLVRNVIGLPELTVRVENLTDQPVEAFTVDAECFNKFDEPVKAPFKGNVFSGMSQSTVAPGAKENSTWQLSLHGGTGYAKVWLSRVRFADGKELTQTKEEAAQCKGLFKATLRE